MPLFYHIIISGILGCENMDKLIPEYHLPFSKNCELADGTTATVYDANGEAGKKYIYSQKTHSWSKL